MKKFLFIILWLGLAIDVIAQSKLSAYTQIVIADQSSHRGVLRAIDNNDYLDAMIFLNDNSDLDSLLDLGVIINVAVKGAVTAQIPLKALLISTFVANLTRVATLFAFVAPTIPRHPKC